VKKRFFTFLLAMVMVFAALPMQVFSAAEDIVTITVIDQDDKLIPGASVSVVRTYRTGWWGTSTTEMDVTSKNDGTFTFDSSTKTGANSTTHYTATVSCEGFATESHTLSPDANSVVVELTRDPEDDQWYEFKVYYIGSGRFPSSFSGAGDPKDYGPSGDDTPFVTINVNTTLLKLRTDCVLYETNQDGNSFHFVPVGIDSEDDLTEEEKLACAKKFWEAVLECTDEESKSALKATGLSDSFVAYCLKNMGSASDPNCHADGVLEVKPPVYVIEMHADHAYFGGFARDSENVSQVTFEDVTAAYATHYGQTINWVYSGDTTSCTGTYVHNGFEYTIKITQTNIKPDTEIITVGNISYVQQVENQYYLAVYNANEENKEQVEFTVTYTDGLTDVVFLDQVTPHEKYSNTSSFEGITDREGYIFKGWVLQGVDGKIMSQQEILETYPTVTSDMTFVAVYDVAPVKYYGTVEVILDGTYDTATATATGTRVDIEKVTGYSELYVKAVNSDTYIHLVSTSEGVYSANLENGDYQIYYYKDKEYTLASDQYLTISHANRTRYLFFNSVTYDTNGCSNGPDPATEYYPTGSAVLVSETVPTLEGYDFLGWKANDIDTLLQPGVTLDTSIGKAYTLVAQWQEVADLYVNITLLHGDNTAPSKSDIDFTVDYQRYVYRMDCKID